MQAEFRLTGHHTYHSNPITVPAAFTRMASRLTDSQQNAVSFD
uniref:Uncharacterized protein n=1 Tax=Anguilla anguilla TaxID=7936 RepID=A0A0E9Q5J4_ANGAN